MEDRITNSKRLSLASRWQLGQGPIVEESIDSCGSGNDEELTTTGDACRGTERNGSMVAERPHGYTWSHSL